MMAEGPGGYRPPQKPSAVSGPGKYAQRTDGGVSQPVRDMQGGSYGENAELANLQGSAPMNASARMSAGAMQAPQGAGVPTQGPSVTPFDAPTQRPDEPVTAGSPLGEGPGPAPMPQQDPDAKYVAKWLPMLEGLAKSPDSSETFRKFVSYAKGVTQ